MNAPERLTEEVIRPAPFEPPRPPRGPSLRLTPVQIVIAMALLAIAAVLLFIVTARSVRIEVVPRNAEFTIDTLAKFELGGVYLLQRGSYPVRATAEGYYPLEQEITVGPEQNQTIKLELVRLPGRLKVESNAAPVTVYLDGERVEPDSEGWFDAPAGLRTLRVEAPRYFPLEMDVEVAGRRAKQTVNAPLEPAWADVSFQTQPPGATISVDGEPRGTTPAAVQILQGEHEVHIKLPGYAAWQRSIRVIAGEPQAFGDIELTKANGLVMVKSNPAGAGVSLDGIYQGPTPIEIAVPPGKPHQIELRKTGFALWQQRITTEPETERTLTVRLEPVTGTVNVDARPENALLYVDGHLMGRANRRIELPAVPHEIEIRAKGYQPFSGKVTPRPGFEQEVRVRLMTLEEARIAAIKPEIVSPGGQRMLLLNPTKITLGASRREPGRRANEVLHEVELTRPFYLSEKEVTNAEFRRFRPAHDSGEFEGLSLDDDAQPVVNVSWADAAAYCNWLSEQEDRTPVYVLDADPVTFRPNANGYRLPTEAEWAWAARYTPDGLLKFPWGDGRKPPDRQGNYADRTATNIVGRIIFGYTDGYAVSVAPGTYAPNIHGLYDMGGNVAEWVHDYYEIPSGEPSRDPMGPPEGEYHVIRGSSYMHGTITELRLSYRDYGTDGRADVGFRIALPLDVKP